MNFKVSYEATGFTNNGKLVGRALDEPQTAQLNAATLPANVISVIGGYITDDDDQGKTDIHLFVHVDILVEANSEEEADAMEPPSEFLGQIADLMSGGKDLDLDVHSWETTEVDEHESDLGGPLSPACAA